MRDGGVFTTVMRVCAAALVVCAVGAGAARGQGARKDDIAFGTNGRPIAGATVTICQSGATGSPCSPLAAIYTDATLTVPTANPFQTDGLGNYHFYALPGRYVVQISGAGINTYTIADTILPNDPSTPNFNSVTATSIALGGNLTVGGSETVTGTTTLQNVHINGTCTGSGCGGGGSPGGSLNQMQFNASAAFGGSRTLYDNGTEGIAHKGPDPWTDVTAWGALGKGATGAGVTAAISAGSTSVVLSAQPSPTFVAGEGIAIAGAGANGDVLIAGVVSAAGATLTLSTSAQTSVSSATVSYDDTYPIQLGVNSMCATSGALNFPPTGNSNYGVRAPAPIAITTATLASNSVTATLATPLPSQIVTGNYAVIAGNAQSGVNGTFAVTVVDSTHVTYTSVDSNGTGTGGTVNFPAFQIPSPCYDFYLNGGNDVQATNVQFVRPPKTQIIQNGTSLAPPFILTGSLRTASIEKVVISGYNQALQIMSGAGFNLTDVGLSVGYSSNPQGASADNTPLAIYNTFWVRIRDSVLSVGNGGHASQFAAVMSFVGNMPQPINMGLIKFEDVIGSGGSYLIDARENGGANGGGNFIWENSQNENSSAPFLTVTSTSSTSMPEIGPIRMFEGADFDCGTGQPFIELNSATTALGPVWIYMAPQCTTGSGEAIRVDAGTIDNVHIMNTDNETADSNGNLVGPAIVETSNGIDLLSGNTTNQQVTYAGAFSQGASLRFAKSGDTNADIGLNAFSGLLMGPGGATSVCGTTSSTICGGYDESLVRNSTETTDLQYAAALPVTNFTATATTGGTLSPGTYYYAMETAGPVSNTYSNYTYTSVTVSSPNNAVALSWTAPGGTNPQGCVVFRSTNAGFVSKPYYIAASNCVSTTTFTDTNGTASGTGTALTYNQTLAPFYHFAGNGAHPSGGTVPYYSGTPTSGDCVQWGGSGLLSDAGGGCGGSFSGLGTGTNTSATMTVGSGASIAVSGTGAVTATKVSPAGTANDCVKWGSSGALADAGAACGTGLPAVTSFSPAPNGAGSAAAPSSANAINVVKFLVPLSVTFGNLVVDVGTSDSTGGHLYDAGIYSASGSLQCDWGATALTSTGKQDIACAQGSVTLSPGYYVFAWTGNATTATIFFGTSGGGGWQQFTSATSGTASSGGALPSSISVPSAGVVVNSTYSNVFIYMH